jgi:hypothetical protein
MEGESRLLLFVQRTIRVWSATNWSWRMVPSSRVMVAIDVLLVELTPPTESRTTR